MTPSRTTRKMLVSTAFVLATMVFAVDASAELPIYFDLHGYYRARGVWTMNLFDAESPNAYGYGWALPYEDPNHTYYLTMRARLEPEIRIAEALKIKSTMDVFDNVVWGDNENIAATPFFAGDPSTTQPDGTVVDAFKVRRVWVEWTTLFGLLRLGRQPSHWGMGLLANSGDGFDDDFGDNNGGSTYDRVIFATRPIDLVKGLAENLSGNTYPGPKEFPWIFAIGFDKLVESSQERYYSNFPCTDGDTTNDSGCDEYGDGSSFLSPNTESGYRQNPIWLSDRGDDVNELVLASVFKKEGWQVSKRHEMDLTVGVYAVHRWQSETDSDAWIVDGYLNWKFRGFFLQAEGYKIMGSSKAIAPKGDVKDSFDCSFSELMDDSWTHANESSCKAANIGGYAIRAGYERWFLKFTWENGMATGDPDLLDPVYTGRQLHPDHNVGLVLYKIVMPQLTREAYANNADYAPLWAEGGVYNSVYIFPRVKLVPTEMMDFRLGVLAAWADRAGGNTTLPLLDDEVHDTSITMGDTDDDGQMDSWRDKGLVKNDRSLGIEIDAATHFHFLEEHIDISLEFGWLHAHRRLQQAMLSSYSPAELNANPAIAQRLSNIYTIQLRTAFIW